MRPTDNGPQVVEGRPAGPHHIRRQQHAYRQFHADESAARIRLPATYLTDALLAEYRERCPYLRRHPLASGLALRQGQRLGAVPALSDAAIEAFHEHRSLFVGNILECGHNAACAGKHESIGQTGHLVAREPSAQTGPAGGEHHQR